jgi:hypothetical protein
MDQKINLNETDYNPDLESGQWQSPTQPDFSGTPRIIQWVIRYSGGLVRNERQASFVVLGFVALAIIVFLITIFTGGSEVAPPPPTPFEEGNL